MPPIITNTIGGLMRGEIISLSTEIGKILESSIPKAMDNMVLKKVNELLRIAVEEIVEKKRYERGGKYYRWGKRPRKFFESLFGTLKSFKIPRIRRRFGKGEISYIKKHERRAIKLNDFLLLMFFGSSSLRGIRSLLKNIFNVNIHFSGIGKIIKRYSLYLRDEYKKSIKKHYVSLVLDGVYFTIRGKRKLHIPKKKMGMIFAIGVTENGKTEVLDYEPTKGESSEDYKKILKRLYDRGLKDVEIIVGDDVHGLWDAASDIYPFAKKQKCLFHIQRNLIRELEIKDMEYIANFKGDYWYMFSTTQYDVFEERFEKFKMKYLHEHGVLKILNRNFPYMGIYLKMNWAYKNKIRTSNMAESFFRNLRRFMGKFPGFNSIEHMLDTVTIYFMGSFKADWRYSYQNFNTKG